MGVIGIYYSIKIIKSHPKQPKNYNNYDYRKKLRQAQNEYAKIRYNKKRRHPQRKIDPNMISSEPLDFEKAGDLKYKAYVQAQWDEINRKYYGGK